MHRLDLPVFKSFVDWILYWYPLSDECLLHELRKCSDLGLPRFVKVITDYRVRSKRESARSEYCEHVEIANRLLKWGESQYISEIQKIVQTMPCTHGIRGVSHASLPPSFPIA